MAGHVDKWCLANCDPHLFSELDKVDLLPISHQKVCTDLDICVFYVWIYFQVDMEVCEQCFSWISQYTRMTRRMKRSIFIFLLHYMCDSHNEREVQKLARSNFM